MFYVFYHEEVTQEYHYYQGIMFVCTYNNLLFPLFLGTIAQDFLLLLVFLQTCVS